MSCRVAVTYNAKKKCTGELPIDYYSEFDSEKTINAIKDTLEDGGNEVVLVEVNYDLLDFFKNNHVDIVFNIAEGTCGNSRESQVPAILDFLGIPYTGSGVLTLAMAMDKAMTKKILRCENIPTPNFQLFKDYNDTIDPHLAFPLIVKPNMEGSAKGISTSSVVHNNTRLKEEVKKVIDTYHQEALVEEFIDGKEITVGILGNGNPDVLPPMEIDFSGCKESGEYFYSWRMKEYQGDASKHLVPTFYCPARIDKEVERKVSDVALRAHLLLGCLDMSRIDIRLSNKDNIPYVLEVNPLPGLDPDESNLTLIAKRSGMSYKDLINGILGSALKRNMVYQKDLKEKFGVCSIVSCGAIEERRNFH